MKGEGEVQDEFHRMKGEGEVLSVTLEAGFIKFYQLFQRSLVIGGRGGHSTSAFNSVI